MTAPLHRLAHFVVAVRAALAALDGAEEKAAGVSGISFPGRENRSADRSDLALAPGEIPRARVGRMVAVLPPWRCVLVQPLERLCDGATQNTEDLPALPPAFRELPLVALSRVPCAGDCVLDTEGRNLRVLNVRHLTAGDVAAELHVEQLRALPEETGEPRV